VANFLRTLALPEEMVTWSLTTIREKLVKIGARIVHGPQDDQDHREERQQQAENRQHDPRRDVELGRPQVHARAGLLPDPVGAGQLARTHHPEQHLEERHARAVLVSLSHTQGHAAAVAASMTDEVRARMKAIPLGDGTVLDLYDQWQGVSGQLGTVQGQIARLKQPSESLAAQIQSARREWIRWAKILMTTAENAKVSPETDAILFAPLREALQRADARWRNGPAPTPPARSEDPTKK